MTEQTQWSHIEMISAVLTGCFREDAVTGYQLVPTHAEMPCIMIELVSPCGARESLGLLFGSAPEDIRGNAAKLADDFGLPLIDHTLPIAQRCQQ